MKKTLVVSIALTIMILVSCEQKVIYLDSNGNEVDVQKEYLYKSGNRFEIIEEIDSGLYEVRDTQTGVHYYYYGVGGGLSLSPVYESYGRVRVTN